MGAVDFKSIGGRAAIGRAAALPVEKPPTPTPVEPIRATPPAPSEPLNIDKFRAQLTERINWINNELARLESLKQEKDQLEMALLALE